MFLVDCLHIDVGHDFFVYTQVSSSLHMDVGHDLFVYTQVSGSPAVQIFGRKQTLVETSNDAAKPHEVPTSSHFGTGTA